MTASAFSPAGDSRVNVYPGLGALHTIFMRYHNYVAEELAAGHSDYDDEKLFQEARKIVIAVLQRITYNGNKSQKTTFIIFFKLLFYFDDLFTSFVFLCNRLCTPVGEKKTHDRIQY